MKIIDNDKVYIQSFEVENILKYISDEIPEEIEGSLLDSEYSEENKRDFLVFYRKDMVEFLSGLDEVIDYKKYVNYSHEELLMLDNSLREQRGILVGCSDKRNISIRKLDLAVNSMTKFTRDVSRDFEGVDFPNTKSDNVVQKLVKKVGEIIS